jgi:thymidylate synthase ThyX
MADEQVFDTYTPAELEILKEYISDPEGDTFVVRLPPGMGGATFARYSRAKGSWKKTFLKEFVQEGKLDPAKADGLIARVLVGYGDDSVGELEGAHLALENISNLATKVVEDARIGVAYIEQSSRYVVYDQKDQEGRYRYLQDPKKNPIMESGNRDAFVKGMDRVFDIYCGIVRDLQSHLKKVKPIDEVEYKIRETAPPLKLSALTDEGEIAAFKRAYTFDIRSKACDIARVLLPAATLTNVGTFCNGRAYQNILNRMYASELPEMRVLGERAHDALDNVIRRFVERARPTEKNHILKHLVDTNREMQRVADEILSNVPVREEEDIVLLDNGLDYIAEQAERQMAAGNFDPRSLPAMHQDEFQVGMVAYMLYKYVEHPMRQIREVVRQMPAEKRQQIIDTYQGSRTDRRQKPGRALEYGYDLFYDIVGDFGIFRDLHRQRMLTMERQLLSTRNGFVELHPILEEIKADPLVRECADISSDLYEKIRAEQGREIAQYPVLFGHNIRFAQGFNDRQAVFYWELRTGKQGHPSYRAVCQNMHKLLEKRSPWRAKMVKFADHNDYFWSRAESEASQSRKRLRMGLKNEAEE